MTKDLANENNNIRKRYETAMRDRELEYLDKLNELRAQISQMKVDHTREVQQLELEKEQLKATLQNQRACRQCHRTMN